MELFVTISWLCVALTLVIMAILYHFSRATTVKPSFFFIGYLMIYNQFGSAMYAEKIFNYLSDPWQHLVLTHLFPPIALVVSSRFFRAEAETVFARLKRISRTQAATGSPFALTLLVGAMLGIFGWYLTEVPLHETGLYAILFNPKYHTMAREKSFKLLHSPLLAYAYALLISTLAPYTSILLALRARQAWQKGNLAALVLCAAGLLFAVVAVSIYGARGHGALLFLSVIIAFYFRSGQAWSAQRLVLMGFVVLTVPFLLTFFRMGIAPTLDNIVDVYLNVLDRAAGRGMEDGVWHVDYVQRVGSVGLQGIENVASFLGWQPINIFNVVGRMATRSTTSSISANTNFVIAYFTCFGFFTMLLSTLLVCALDLALVVCVRIGDDYLVPCLACCCTAVATLVGTFFTTFLLSNGFIPILIISYLLSLLAGGYRRHGRMRAQPAN